MIVSWTVPTQAEVAHVAQHMRHADAEECRLMAGLLPADALSVGLSASDASFCALANGEPVAIFGGSNGSMMDAASGVIWELGTTWIDQHPLTFARHSHTGLRMLWDSLDVDRASNYVWIGNEASKRWLWWLGASFDTKVVPGANGGLFVPFTLERER